MTPQNYHLLTRAAEPTQNSEPAHKIYMQMPIANLFDIERESLVHTFLSIGKGARNGLILKKGFGCPKTKLKIFPKFAKSTYFKS